MAHSIRPWTVMKRQPGEPGGFVVVDVEGNVVALVPREDDARLIAMAPDMLAQMEQYRQTSMVGTLTEAGRLVQRAHGGLGS